MNSCLFRSAAPYIREPLDCRQLKLSVDYYQLKQEQIIELADILIQWVYNVTDNSFVANWYCNGKNVPRKLLGTQLRTALQIDRQLKMGFEAFAISPVVYNLATMKNYQRYIRTIHPVYMFGWSVDPLLGEASIDFPEYINERFPSVRPNNEEIIQLIYGLFCEPNRKLRALHSHTDMGGAFSAEQYQQRPDLYYGHAHISFGAFCLNDSINIMADELLLLAEDISEKFLHVNIHVSLQSPHTKGSPYMRYFGKHIAMDGSHEPAGCAVKEWYPTYYLCGVEWSNILSPLTSQHIKLSNKTYSNASIKLRNNGSIMVKSTGPITEYTRSDALVLKEIVLPALYPGKSCIPLRGLFPRQGEHRIFDWFPRHDWSIVPVEVEEIDIVGTDLVYCSLSSML